jgi:VanZ family protein
MLRLLNAPTGRERVLAAVLLAVAVFNLFYHGAQSYAPAMIPSPPWDKLAHLVFFGGVSTLVWVVVAGRHAWTVVAAVALIGGLDEFAQSQTPGRTADWTDWVTDVCASLLAIAVLAALRRRATSRGSS